MHLRQLQLRLRSRSLRERYIADNVSQRLSLGLVLLEYFAFRIVADNLIINEAAKVELC